MTDYATMYLRIEDEIDDAGLRNQVKLAIQSAIAYYSRTRFWFNQVRFTFPIVADDEFFDSTDNAEIPNLLEIDSFTVTQSGIRYPCYPIGDSIIADAQTGLVKYRPSVYAYVRKQIHIFPISDGSYTATVEAFSRLSALSADTDTNAWMTDGEELIRQRAKRILAIDVTKEPSDAQAAEALEIMALQGLQEETAMRRQSQRQYARVDPMLIVNQRDSYNINFD